jgi:rsbT co-antagonist protein RsbR
MVDHKSKLASILRQHEAHLFSEWAGQLVTPTRGGTIGRAEVEEQAKTFLRLFADVLQKEAGEDIEDPAWTPIREMLERISASRARQGVTPSETAMFILSFKRPLFVRLREEYKQDAAELADELWTATVLPDRLGLFTVEAFAKSREQIILRQQRNASSRSLPRSTTRCRGARAEPDSACPSSGSWPDCSAATCRSTACWAPARPSPPPSP